MACIISLHVSCVLRWSGIHDGHGQLRTVSSHTSCVLKRSGQIPLNRNWRLCYTFLEFLCDLALLLRRSWVFLDLFITHFLCFKMIKYLIYPIWHKPKHTHFIWLEAGVKSEYTIKRLFLYQIIFKTDYLIPSLYHFKINHALKTDQGHIPGTENGFFTHLFSLKMIRNIKKPPWVLFNGFFTHPLGLKMIWDMY